MADPSAGWQPAGPAARQKEWRRPRNGSATHHHRRSLEMGWLDPISWLKWVTGIVVVSVTGLGGLLYHFQTNLIYPATMPEGALLAPSLRL